MSKAKIASKSHVTENFTSNPNASSMQGGQRGQQAATVLYVLDDSCVAIIGISEIHAFDLITVRRQSAAKRTAAVTAPISAQGKPTDFARLLKGFPTLTSTEIGKLPDFAHKIRTKPDNQPTVVLLRGVTVHHKNAVKEEVEKMVRDGIWSPIEKSEWAHRLVVVPKFNGEVRITTDLRSLNASVIPDRYPAKNPKEGPLPTS